MANCGRMVRDRAMVTLESLSLFRIVTSLAIYVLSFPPNGSPQYTPQDQLRNACCHLANMITDIDKAAVCCAGCHYELSDVAFFTKLLWPLLLILQGCWFELLFADMSVLLPPPYSNVVSNGHVIQVID